MSSASDARDDSDEKSRAFIPVKTEREHNELLNESAKTFASAIIWTKDQSKVIRSHISAVMIEDSILYAWMPKNFVIEDFRKELEENRSSTCYFSVSLSRANVFFKTDFIGFDKAGLKFSTPDDVYKVQRRKDFRLPIEESKKMFAQFKDPLFRENDLRKKILDVSAGGIAIEVERDEERMFKSGDRIQSLSFLIDQKEILVEAEIRYARPIPPNPRKARSIELSKVGLMFTKITPRDTQAIAAYVFEESRKYFSKFM